MCIHTAYIVDVHCRCTSVKEKRREYKGNLQLFLEVGINREVKLEVSISCELGRKESEKLLKQKEYEL